MTAADWIRAAVTILSAGIAALVAAQVALHRWRVEMIGKRRAELAEEVLTDFLKLHHEAQIFKQTYSSLSGDREQQERFLREKEALFREEAVKQYRFVAVFGSKAVEPFNDMMKAADNIHAITSGVVCDALSHMEPFANRATGKMVAICRAAIMAEEDRRWW